MDSPAWYAVVIAGGSSRRFGRDKLSAPLGAATVLDQALSAIPAHWPILVVGQPRKLQRTVSFVSEEPPGSGPGAALVAGARAVRARGGTRMVCLPGDAPAGGQAALALVAAVTEERTAVVAVDATGQAQPLQIAVTGAALDALAAHAVEAVIGSRARDLVDQLGAQGVPLVGRLTVDIDTPADAERWLDGQP